MSLQEDQDFWSQGIAHHQKGELTQAEQCYRRIDPAVPGYEFVLNNLGLLLNSLGRLTEAEECLLNALAIAPDQHISRLNYANTLLSMGRLNEAETYCLAALSLQPNFLEALCTLGNIYSAAGRMSDAEQAYQNALAVQEESPETLLGLGNVYFVTGRHQLAVEIYLKVLTKHPNLTSALNNLAHMMFECGCYQKSRDLLEQALEHKPTDLNALLNYGRVLNTLGLHEEAEHAYRKALSIRPDFLEALNNLIFMHNYQEDGNLENYSQDVRRYGILVAKRASPFIHSHHGAKPERRLRVGMISGDLLNHPVGYFLAGILRRIDQDAIELYAYSNHGLEDELTQELKGVMPHWLNVVGMSDEQLAHRIHEDGIDILVDLSGHTARNRLPVFAWKPAPVQITWLGFFATTGLTAMDYILGDHYNLPEEESFHFAETPWRLPECYLCFTPPDLSIDVAPLPALRNRWITFGNCNRIEKWNDQVFECWAEVLKSVPNSRLLLKSLGLRVEDEVRRIRDHWNRLGFSEERIILEGPSPRSDYFHVYDRIDIILDSFPYPGVTTSVEGLWMGVPFIAMKGRMFLSHQGESILANAGLADWIATDSADYIAKAVHFAGDLEGLARLRSRLRDQVMRSALFDAERFGDHLVQAWRTMWRLWCSGRRPSNPRW
ncbi:MAG: tetratricopeptide repeat protein [Magnetococcales bacterium]|nr:tetratricopeptide repeat protein [Magnetococcales bacterium]